jgi:hypothetical protein
MSQLCTSLSVNRMSGTGRLCEPEKAFHWIVLILCVLAVTVSLLLRYDGEGLSVFGIQWPVSCALYENFGVKCALCGLTRSFCAMASSEFSAAVHFHLLGPAIFVFVCLQIPYRIHALWATCEDNGVLRRIGIYLAFGLTGGLLINWLVYLGGHIG